MGHELVEDPIHFAIQNADSCRNSFAPQYWVEQPLLPYKECFPCRRTCSVQLVHWSVVCYRFFEQPPGHTLIVENSLGIVNRDIVSRLKLAREQGGGHDFHIVCALVGHVSLRISTISLFFLREYRFRDLPRSVRVRPKQNPLYCHLLSRRTCSQLLRVEPSLGSRFVSIRGPCPSGAIREAPP